MVSLRGALVMPTGLGGGTERAQKPPTALSTSLTLLPHPEALSAPNPESETPTDILEPQMLQPSAEEGPGHPVSSPPCTLRKLGAASPAELPRAAQGSPPPLQ